MRPALAVALALVWTAMVLRVGPSPEAVFLAVTGATLVRFVLGPMTSAEPQLVGSLAEVLGGIVMVAVFMAALLGREDSKVLDWLVDLGTAFMGGLWTGLAVKRLVGAGLGWPLEPDDGFTAQATPPNAETAAILVLATLSGFATEVFLGRFTVGVAALAAGGFVQTGRGYRDERGRMLPGAKFMVAGLLLLAAVVVLAVLGGATRPPPVDFPPFPSFAPVPTFDVDRFRPRTPFPIESLIVR